MKQQADQTATPLQRALRLPLDIAAAAYTMAALPAFSFLKKSIGRVFSIFASNRWCGVSDTVMMLADGNGDYARALTAILQDDGIDMVIVINVTPLLSNPIDILDSVAATARGAAKPVVAVMMATRWLSSSASSM